jgi:cyclic pyranopterin phosphate synthase
LKGFERAVETGLAPIKINMVPMRGINDDEIADMARWTFTAPYDIRYIELITRINMRCHLDKLQPS